MPPLTKLTRHLRPTVRILISPFTSTTMAGNSTELDNLHFDNLALKKLPLDQEQSNFTRQVSGACFSLIDPSPVDNPQLVVHSKAALELLGLPETVSDNTYLVLWFDKLL